MGTMTVFGRTTTTTIALLCFLWMTGQTSWAFTTISSNTLYSSRQHEWLAPPARSMTTTTTTTKQFMTNTSNSRKREDFNDDDDDKNDSTTSLPWGQPPLPQPTAAQQEQLNKYGPTPETSMEILFDQLLAGNEPKNSGDGDGTDVWAQTGADDEAREKWQSFMEQMREMKQSGMAKDDNDDEDP